MARFHLRGIFCGQFPAQILAFGAVSFLAQSLNFEKKNMSRREISSRKAERRQALERLRAEKDDGKSAVEQLELKDESLFDQVTEQEYESLVRERRAGGPFVEEDGDGLGYYDDGEEQFFEEPDEDEEQQQKDETSGKMKGQGALSMAYVKRAKRKQRAKLGDTNASSRVANAYFTKTAGTSSSNTGKVSRKPKPGTSL